MSTVVALFSNTRVVGKTTSAYHLAHMSARLGLRTLAVDLDPQANLSSAFFDEERLGALWETDEPTTVTDGVDPLSRGLGDIVVPKAQEVAEGLHVLPGDLGLSSFEDNLSSAWPRGFDGDEAALRTTTAFHRIVQGCVANVGAEIAFVDVGPNLGAINRAALLTADHILIPLAADLFGLQGLRNLGPMIRRWRESWEANVLPKLSGLDLDAPRGRMESMGYLVLRQAAGLARRGKAFDRWLTQIPEEFVRAVLGEEHEVDAAAADPHCLATLRNYRSLMPLAQDARKPMFDLRAADGALGSTARLVQICHKEFHDLAVAVLDRAAAARRPRRS